MRKLCRHIVRTPIYVPQFVSALILKIWSQPCKGWNGLRDQPKAARVSISLLYWSLAGVGIGGLIFGDQPSSPAGLSWLIAAFAMMASALVVAAVSLLMDARQTAEQS